MYFTLFIFGLEVNLSHTRTRLYIHLSEVYCISEGANQTNINDRSLSMLSG